MNAERAFSNFDQNHNVNPIMKSIAPTNTNKRIHSPKSTGTDKCYSTSPPLPRTTDWLTPNAERWGESSCNAYWT
jgi:hypothetical protein